ncbi:MAG: trigger factor [Proteobacteria bacterium]|jgi:trigger factor|nr:trigger factor [Pseudomonadota bacterium]
METIVETLGDLERRLSVAVPVADIEGEVTKRLSNLARTAKIAGFRPGKVPVTIIARQYGPQVRSDVISDAVRSRFNEAVQKEHLRIAGTPRIEPNSAGVAQGALEFSAVFEVYPEVRLGDLSQIVVRRPVTEVTAADIDRTIGILRRQRATYVPAARPAQGGDRVRVDFTGTIDGVEFAGGQAHDFAIELGEGRMLPEFDKAMTGMSAGEQKTFPLRFPDDYHGREVAGKEAQFALRMLAVEEIQLPALDADFVRAFGVASGEVEGLRAEVAANLRLELKRKVAALVKEQVIAGLAKVAQFPLPKALVDAEARLLHDRTIASMRDQPGVKPEDLAVGVDVFRPQAEQRVALGLMMAELVKTEHLEARPEQVKELVHESAQSYEQPDAVIRWHYEKPERLGDFEAAVLEQNVVDWVLARAKVTDEPAAFEAVMGPRGNG